LDGEWSSGSHSGDGCFPLGNAGQWRPLIVRHESERINNLLIASI
jgi:hypothetical protein